MMMSDLLDIQPEVIEFPVVFRQSITTNLRLTNIANSPVAFKIKTTAPKNYLVRPSTGVIGRDKVMEIQIILNPLSDNPVSFADRFLVQATPVADLADAPTKDFWSTVDKSVMADQRLNVVFKNVDVQEGAKGLCTAGNDGSSRASCPNGTTPTMRITELTQGVPTDPAEFASTYERLIRHVVELEGSKMNLEQEIETLRRRLQQTASVPGGRDGLSVAKSEGGIFGFELWHIVPIFVAVLFMLRYLGYV